jgi:hypothetical protein
MAAEVTATALYQSDMTTLVGISTSVTTTGGDRTIGQTITRRIRVLTP